MPFSVSFRGALWRAFDGVRNDARAHVAELRHWERQGASENRRHQWNQLERLLRHSVAHVPYYRNLLRDVGAVSPTGTVTREAFSRIPLLDKATLRTQFEQLKSDDIDRRKWRLNSSGGSTGEPVKHVQDLHFYSSTQAVSRLFDEWTGFRVGDGQALLWGSERDLLVGREQLKHELSRRLRKEIWLNAFRMTPDRMREYVRQINALRPVQVLAYADSAYEFARFVEREGLTIYSPRAVMCSAGTLLPEMRETIQRVFRAPVFNRYGSREVGGIACECDRHEGLHVCSPTHVIEILRSDDTPAPPGEVGEIVVTSLANFAMPLIRYRIGDMGAWADRSCSCGRGWPLIQELSGRTTDVFRKRDGTVIPSAALIHMIGVVNEVSWLRRFQAVQDAYERVRILLMPGDETEERQLAAGIASIRKSVMDVMGPECEVTCEVVRTIPPTDSGKYRYTVSHIAGD